MTPQQQTKPNRGGLTVRAPVTEGMSLFWEKPRWGGRERGPALSTRPMEGAEGGAPALGRPREGEGVALGKPRDGEGKLGSDTASGSVDMLLMGSLEDKNNDSGQIK